MPSPINGTWTNEEDRYFTADRGEAAIAWTGIEIADGRWRHVDSAQNEWLQLPFVAMAPDADGRWRLPLPDGRRTELRHATPFTCWMSIPRFAREPDKSNDSLFVRGFRTDG